MFAGSNPWVGERARARALGLHERGVLPAQLVSRFHPMLMGLPVYN